MACKGIAFVDLVFAFFRRILEKETNCFGEGAICEFVIFPVVFHYKFGVFLLNTKAQCPAPQGDFENNLAITLGMLRRPLKTLRQRATGPIVSCMSAAKAPKGTKKTALTPGTMRNHVQSAPGA